ncbi:MAG TPA: hypothetical protein VGI45_30235 [Terracidiphilus sp.]
MSPTDPMTLIGAVLVISIVLLGVTWLPARRAAHINSIVALRYE